MYPWSCCRTCLNETSLNPIFPVKELNEKYTNAIYSATGIKVEINDDLPHLMCSNCVKTINKMLLFRKKCQETLIKLLTMSSTRKNYQKNVELDHFLKKEHQEVISIDIEEFDNENYADFEDDLPLVSLKSNECLYLDNITIEKADIENVTDDSKIKSKRRRSKEKLPKVIRKQRVRRKGSDAEEKKESEEKDEIECEYCNKVLSSKTSLRNHYKIHTGFDVVCEHCGKKFITRRLLLMHCRAKHGYEKTDKCSYCDYKASNAEQVKIHERLHTGEKPFVCKECGASFHRRSNYLQHVAIHLPEKTVQCDQCPALFKSVTLMRIHKNRHRLPTHKYKCGVCEAVFARRRNATRHLTRIHAVDNHNGNVFRTSAT